MAVPRLRFTLGGLMWLIVVAALVLALVPWKLGPLAFVLGLLVGLGWVIHRVGRITRLRAAVWVCAVYPWLFLAAFYLCWGSACWGPRSPAQIGRWGGGGGSLGPFLRRDLGHPDGRDTPGSCAWPQPVLLGCLRVDRTDSHSGSTGIAPPGPGGSTALGIGFFPAHSRRRSDVVARLTVRPTASPANL